MKDEHVISQEQRNKSVNYACPVAVGPRATATKDELAPLIGACILAVRCREHSLILRLDNGLELMVAARWDGCALGVYVDATSA